ncbi:hypothetical protein N9L26_00940 [Candidatus Pacebacteria bacterium]|nr:hypothetical protein [Candidatus Paceibacterota bacterium]
MCEVMDMIGRLAAAGNSAEQIAAELDGKVDTTGGCLPVIVVGDGRFHHPDVPLIESEK